MTSSTLSPLESERLVPAAEPEASSTKRYLFERIESLGGRSMQGWIAAWAIALTFHVGGAGAAATRSMEINRFAELVVQRVVERLNASIDIEQIEEPEPEVEPEPEPEPEVAPEPEPTPQDIAMTAPSDVTPSESAPPPEAAEAGQVLTADPEPDAPLDLTADGFISGSGTRFAGGTSAAKGTGDKAVRNQNAIAGGAPEAKGKTDVVTGPPAVDKSRPAGLPNANWNNCPFPPEAEAEQINEAVVRVVVVVNTDGSPTSVNVLSDPGYGFGRQARLCALRHKYPVGLDKMGNPTARATRPFRITFVRR